MSDQKECWCFEDINKELEALRKTNAALQSRLKAYEEGVKLKDADKDQRYHWHNGEEWVVLFWNESWKFKAVKILPIELNVIDEDLDRLYPLPPTEQGGE